jgi:hypothetical protein
MIIGDTIKTGKTILVSVDRLRTMSYENGKWEVWGQSRKYDRNHLIERGTLNKCLSALIGGGTWSSWSPL